MTERQVFTRAYVNGDPDTNLRLGLSRSQADLLRNLMGERVRAHGVAGLVPDRESDLLYTLDVLLDSQE